MSYHATNVGLVSPGQDPDVDDRGARLVSERHVWAQISGLPGSIGLSLLSVCVLLPFARLDFDKHHDGITLAAAIAARSGFHVQRDAFAQYGPVTPWLQAAALLLPISAALAIRLLNVLLIAVVVFVLSDIGRRAPAYWPTTLWGGRLAATAWIGLADVFGWVPMLPWSSTVAAALSAVALYCIVMALHHCSLERVSIARPWSFTAGVMVGILPFARVNVGLATLATFAVLGVAVAVVGGPESTCARLGLLGAAASGIAVVLALAVTGSLNSWWQQSIVWPARWQNVENESLDTGRRFADTVKGLWLPLIIITIFSVVYALVRRADAATNRRLRAMNIVFGCFLAPYFFLLRPRSDTIFSGRITQGNGWIAEIDKNFNYLAFLSWSVLVIAPIYVLVRLCSALLHHFGIRSALSWLLLGGFSLAGLVQIWPVSDTRHYWWGLPVGLLFLLSIPSSPSSSTQTRIRSYSPYLAT